MIVLGSFEHFGTQKSRRKGCKGCKQWSGQSLRGDGEVVSPEAKMIAKAQAAPEPTSRQKLIIARILASISPTAVMRQL